MEKETNIPELKDLEKVLIEEGTRFEHWLWQIKGTNIRHHPTQRAIQYKNGDWGWAWMNEPHRLDGPALFWTGEYEYWIRGERLSREDWLVHPLRVEWLRKNKLGAFRLYMEKETNIPELKDLEKVLSGKGWLFERWDWKIKGTEIWHHPTEPSIQYKDGDWVWFWMNQEHRLDGPAMYMKGQYRYWIQGRELIREDWDVHPLRVEWLRTKKLGGI